jgi:hypothetical protein
MLEKTIIIILIANRELIIAAATTVTIVVYVAVVTVIRVILRSMNLQLLPYCLYSTDLYNNHYHMPYHLNCLQRIEFKKVMVVNSKIHKCSMLHCNVR